MLVRASMLPTNVVSGKSVAELPICQNTLQDDPPPINATVELAAVVSVLAILKMNTPPPLSVSVPVSCADDE
jgi:hypothetical protein